MATVKVECETLKIRVGKREGNDKITIVDHVAKSSYTCTVFQGFQSLKDRIARGESEHVIHVVDHKSEKKRKATNPNGSTRMVLNTFTPEAWSALQIEKDRYVEIAIDPSIAVLLMIRALRLQDEDTLRTWLRDGHEQEGDAPASDLAPSTEAAKPEEQGEIPDWLKP